MSGRLTVAGMLDLQWRKSSYSGDNGACVELAVLTDGRVAMRDSKAPTAGTLMLSHAGVADWLTAVRSGEFDLA